MDVLRYLDCDAKTGVTDCVRQGDVNWLGSVLSPTRSSPYSRGLAWRGGVSRGDGPNVSALMCRENILLIRRYGMEARCEMPKLR